MDLSCWLQIISVGLFIIWAILSYTIKHPAPVWFLFGVMCIFSVIAFIMLLVMQHETAAILWTVFLIMIPMNALLVSVNRDMM